MKVIDAPIAAKACDHYGHLRPDQAAGLRAAGYEGIFLYVEIVTEADIAAAHEAGLWVGFLLEGLASHTPPTEELGESMATRAATSLRDLSVPPGVTLFSDLEGDGHPPEAWIAFANGAGNTTTGLGDIAGAYIGEGLGLTSPELYALHVHRYWKSMSQVIDRNGHFAEPSCGWCVVQGFPTHDPPGALIEVDSDFCYLDYARRAATVAAAA